MMIMSKNTVQFQLPIFNKYSNPNRPTLLSHASNLKFKLASKNEDALDTLTQDMSPPLAVVTLQEGCSIFTTNFLIPAVNTF